MTPKTSLQSFIQIFNLEEDASKPGRVLSSAKIGNVYMSRSVISPGVVTGNSYHRDTQVMFYVERGDVSVVFEHTQTKEKKEFCMESDKTVIHIPSMVAHATKNIGDKDAVLVFFSDRELRSEDRYSYILLA
jgi:dTDP-4-dehydrorhamnose 3,5-epimerase-like enzyme